MAENYYRIRVIHDLEDIPEVDWNRVVANASVFFD